MKNEQTIGGISFNLEAVGRMTQEQFVERYLKVAKKQNLMSRKTDAEKTKILGEYYGQLKAKTQPDSAVAVKGKDDKGGK